MEPEPRVNMGEIGAFLGNTGSPGNGVSREDTGVPPALHEVGGPPIRLPAKRLRPKDGHSQGSRRSAADGTNPLRPAPQLSSGAITRLTMAITLIRMFIEGPEVSLNGSPTVSPTTVA